MTIFNKSKNMITCKSEQIQYQTTFSNGHLTSYADATEDKGGKGAGFRPHELLEAAFASCLNMHLRMYADHHNISLDGVSTTVTLDRNLPNDAIFKYSIDLKGSLSEEQRSVLLRIVKTCPVRKTLSKVISFKEISSA
jgi:putative redox protein